MTEDESRSPVGSASARTGDSADEDERRRRRLLWLWFGLALLVLILLFAVCTSGGDDDEPGALPAIVHCASGNRVGALFAIQALYLDGRSAAEALEIGKRAGLTHVGPAIRELLGLTLEDPN